MKKSIYFISVLSILLIAALTGCGQNELSSVFEEDTIKQEAMKAIEFFNARDYQSIIDMGSDALKESITAEEFAQASDPYLDKCGEFIEISKNVVFGTSNGQTDENFGVTVMIGKYEEGQIQFTVAFDEEMKLVQFTIK